MRSRRCSNLSSAGTKNPSGHVGADDRTSARLKLEIHASPKNMLVECNLVANSPVVIEAGIPKINVEIFKFGSNQLPEPTNHRQYPWRARCSIGSRHVGSNHLRFVKMLRRQFR